MLSRELTGRPQICGTSSQEEARDFTTVNQFDRAARRWQRRDGISCSSPSRSAQEIGGRNSHRASAAQMCDCNSFFAAAVVLTLVGRPSGI